MWSTANIVAQYFLYAQHVVPLALQTHPGPHRHPAHPLWHDHHSRGMCRNSVMGYEKIFINIFQIWLYLCLNAMTLVCTNLLKLSCGKNSKLFWFTPTWPAVLTLQAKCTKGHISQILLGTVHQETFVLSICHVVTVFLYPTFQVWMQCQLSIYCIYLIFLKKKPAHTLYTNTV